MFSAFRGPGCPLKRFLVPQTGFRFKTVFGLITVFGSAGVFLGPALPEHAINTWKDQFKKVVKRSCSGKLRCSALGAVQWVEDPQIPEGSQYIRASKPTFAGMMASYNRRRELIAQKQLALARDETGKAKLELAEKYRAYLAASWALWCGMRRGNARQLRVNLNIWRGREADGNDALVRVLCQAYLVYFIYALLVFYERLFFWGPKSLSRCPPSGRPMVNCRLACDPIHFGFACDPIRVDF